MIKDPNDYRLFIHDFECYTFTVDKNPVWFLSCAALEVATEKVYYFEVSNRINQKKELREFLLQKDIWLLGYNNINYDNVLAQAFLESDLEGEELVKYLYDVTEPIFREELDQSEVRDLRARYVVQNSDLCTMYFQKGFQKPLKMIGIFLKHPLIYEGNIESKRDYSLKDLGFTSLEELFEDKKKYNINDVYITFSFFKSIQKEWNMRTLSKKFNIDFYSDSESSIANKLGLRLYAKELINHIPEDSFDYEYVLSKVENTYRNKTTKRDKVYFKDCIVNVPKFETKFLNSLLENILDSYWTPNHKYKANLHIGNVIGSVGVGGIHLFNCDRNADYDYLYKNTFDSQPYRDNFKAYQKGICYKQIPKNKLVKEIDVASLYPSTWINSGMFPEHLSREFITVYKRQKEERILDKKEGRTFDADWKKLVLNSLWGKTMNEYTFVSDPKVGLMITMTGQLVLLQLIEKLVANEIKVLLSNTDSVVVEIDEKQLNTFNKIVKEWESINNYEMEETDYVKYFARDVNCYLGLDKKGKVKAKNDFSDAIDFKKNMDALIVAKALKEYFLNNVPLEKTITQEEDINMFLITYKPDKKFVMEYTTMVDGEPYTRIIQRINRWYITKRFGKLFSVGVNDKDNITKTDRAAGYYVRVLNDFSECCDNYEINYDYYISRAQKIAAKVENLQTKLF